MADNKDKAKIAQQALAEYKAGLMYRHDREKAWQIIEDFYFNRSKKSLKGKFNVPVPIMSGFVETWLADMSKHATLTFTHGENQAEYKAAKKTTAFWAEHQSKDDYDFDMADTDAKKIAALSGRAIFENYGQSKPKYKYTLKPVDHYDFYCDPMGGGSLENHKFLGIDNVFLSREDLKQGAEDELYDAGEVSKLINATKEDTLVDNDNQFRSKQNRHTALGLDGITHNYAGQSLYKFIKHGTTYKGVRYYVLLNVETGIAVRCQPLKQVFESDLWWVTSWATNRDTFNFWSKGPSDDMIPIAEVMRVLINQELDNRNKRNYGQRGYDPAIIPDPSQLEWRQDGLVAFKTGTAQLLGDMSKAIFNFETAELKGTLDLTAYLDGLWKEKTGINSEAQGQTDSSKVGIAFLNVQQSAKRRTLTFESYTKCWQANGRRFVWSCHEHIRKPVAVKIIGEQGEEWEQLARMEVNPEWGIRVEDAENDLAKDEIKKKQLRELLSTFTEDELMVTSPKWRAKTKLQAAGIDEDEIRMAFDLEGDHNKEILAEASQLIQDCLEGKEIKLNRGATTAFVQKIIDYATDTDLETPEYMKLMQVAEAHLPIAEENMIRKGMQQRTQMGMGAMPMQEPQEPNYAELSVGGEQQNPQTAPQQTPRQLTPQADYAPTR